MSAKHLGFVRLHQQFMAGAGVEFRLDVPDTGIPEALDGPPDSGGALAHRVGVTGEEEKGAGPSAPRPERRGRTAAGCL